MELISDDGLVKVEWTDLGEGYSGDYDPEDLEDEELLRFDVSIHKKLAEEYFPYASGTVDDWYDPGDVSYCTTMPTDTPDDILMEGLKFILQEVEGPLKGGRSVKRRCEELSWMSPWWFTTKEEVTE